MIGIVLGNGPSKVAYNRGGHMVIGCNIPGDEFSVDATVVCDEEIVWVLKSKPELINVPLIVSTRAFEKLKELRLEDKYDIQHVFSTREWFNSAHYAAEFLAACGCTEIEVWGCDSVFSDNINSTTDAYVPKQPDTSEKLLRNWRRIWNELFDAYPTIKFKIIRIE